MNMIDKNPVKIKNIFNEIAYSYDFMNNLISLGLHLYVKKQAIKLLNVHPKSKILDICCGSGDTSKLIKIMHKKTNVYAVDFSENMLNIARKKCRYVEFLNCDVTKLPFEKCYFDTITETFGLRNIENINVAIEQIFKILKPNGEFLHLDFEENCLASKIFNIFVSLVCKIFKKRSFAYKYLINSKKEFYNSEELVVLFEKYGFRLKKKKYFLFGAICALVFSKY